MDNTLAKKAKLGSRIAMKLELMECPILLYSESPQTSKFTIVKPSSVETRLHRFLNFESALSACLRRVHVAFKTKDLNPTRIHPHIV